MLTTVLTLPTLINWMKFPGIKMDRVTRAIVTTTMTAFLTRKTTAS